MNKTALSPLRSARLAVARPRFWKLGILESFLLIHFLASGLVLLPGGSQIRIVFRALPYVSSLVLWVWLLVVTRPLGKNTVSHYLLAAALVILAVSVFVHPATIPGAGMAQLVYQLTIAGPFFWVKRLPVNLARLQKLIWIMFICNALSTAVGALQIYYPDTFMPKDFTSGLTEEYINSMTFEGTGGQIIIRPPELTDLPGGAATAAIITAFLGLVLMSQSKTKLLPRVCCVVLTLTGLFVLYLTQVRSYFLDLVIMTAVVVFFRVVKKRVYSAAQILVFASVLVIAAFTWAVSIGGAQVSERFTGLAEQGLIESYEQNRGNFVTATFEQVLPYFPLGAGVGRWGIINQYFAQSSPLSSLYAEIQLTGWAYDGGWPLLLTYSGAIVVTVVGLLRLAWRARGSQWEMVTQIVLCVDLLVTIQVFAGPSFNTQSGILFWFLAGLTNQAAVAAAGAATRRREIRVVLPGGKSSGQPMRRGPVRLLPVG